mmetsp:Transcript_3722/g.7895  ORF Transcript_3722/g.7895 Transcript_3722/m.7895 type:complete len:275 (+) Transcript_3722:593-1417(+)
MCIGHSGDIGHRSIGMLVRMLRLLRPNLCLKRRLMRLSSVVCVASLADCPANTLCPGTRPEDETSFSSPSSCQYQLCNDGSCADLTASQMCDPASESPCDCDVLPFGCAKQIDLYLKCVDLRSGEFYDANALCLEEQEESLEQVDFAGPWFLTSYVGMACVTAAILVWCAWNQRWSHVEGSVVELETAVGLGGEGARDSAAIGAQRGGEGRRRPGRPHRVREGKPPRESDRKRIILSPKIHQKPDLLLPPAPRDLDRNEIQIHTPWHHPLLPCC